MNLIIDTLQCAKDSLSFRGVLSHNSQTLLLSDRKLSAPHILNHKGMLHTIILLQYVDLETRVVMSFSPDVYFGTLDA